MHPIYIYPHCTSYPGVSSMPGVPSHVLYLPVAPPYAAPMMLYQPVYQPVMYYQGSHPPPQAMDLPLVQAMDLPPLEQTPVPALSATQSLTASMGSLRGLSDSVCDDTKAHRSLAEQELFEIVQRYILERNPEGTVNYIQMQTALRENNPQKVHASMLLSKRWATWFDKCPEFTRVVYSTADVVRLQLTGWAEAGEPRFRMTTSTMYESIDSAAAVKHAVYVQRAIAVCFAKVSSDGPTSLAEIKKLLSQEIPYFSQLSKGGFKRILNKAPNSPLWLKNNTVLKSLTSQRAEEEVSQGF